MVGSKRSQNITYSSINRLLKICLLVTLLFFFNSTFSKAEQPAGYTVKTAYIYSFLKFIDWPETAENKTNTNLVICSLGATQLNLAIKSLEGKVVQKRLLVVKDVRLNDELKNCQVLVSGGIRNDQIAPFFKKIAQYPILTVGESEHFARDLGIIGFTVVDERVKLEVNLVRAQAKNIKLSAQLLEVADHIYRQEPSNNEPHQDEQYHGNVNRRDGGQH